MDLLQKNSKKLLVLLTALLVAITIGLVQPVSAQNQTGEGGIYFAVVFNGAPIGCFETSALQQKYLGYMFVVSRTQNLSCNSTQYSLMTQKIKSSQTIEYNLLTSDQVKQYNVLSQPIESLR